MRQIVSHLLIATTVLVVAGCERADQEGATMAKELEQKGAFALADQDFILGTFAAGVLFIALPVSFRMWASANGRRPVDEKPFHTSMGIGVLLLYAAAVGPAKSLDLLKPIFGPAIIILLLLLAVYWGRAFLVVKKENRPTVEQKLRDTSLGK